MSYLVKCPCQNFTLYLEGPPFYYDGLHWLKEEFQLPKGVGKATLSSSGFNTQVPQICRTKIYEKDKNQWKTVTCCNCDTFIYCQKTSVNGTIFVNMLLSSLKDTQLQSGAFFSPVWKVLLNDEDDCSNIVLEPPDVSDQDRYETFKLLEKQLQDYLTVEEKKMRDRIREYEQKQSEEFRELHTRALRDRKVLWTKINKNLDQVVQPEPIASVPTAVPTSTTDTSAKLIPLPIPQIITTSPTGKSSTQLPADSDKLTTPTSTWKNSRITEKKKNTDSSDWLFPFDDEDEQEDKNNDELSQEEEIEPAPVEPEVDYEDFYDPRPSNYQIASSLPVMIPNIPAKFRVPEELPKEKGSANKKGVFKSAYDTPEARTHAEQELELLSKSFAVPMSRNRVRGWL